LVRRAVWGLVGHLGPSWCYSGFDTFAAGVEWCREHMAPLLPNFEFRTVDVFSGVSNPYSHVAAETFRFPCDDACSGLVTLVSVFTRMPPADVRLSGRDFAGAGARRPHVRHAVPHERRGRTARGRQAMKGFKHSRLLIPAREKYISLLRLHRVPCRRMIRGGSGRRRRYAMSRAVVRLAALALACSLLGCAARPGPEVLSPVPPCPGKTRQVSFVVATNREPDPAHPGNFGNGRAGGLSLVRYVISVPPDHKDMHIEWTGASPTDPAKSFATLAAEPLDRQAFVNATESDEGVVVFVHGYNTNFAESVLRMAQLMADNAIRGEAVLFAWPSDGSLPGYVADKDAVTVSRDPLAGLLTQLAARPGKRGITLAAHSMGCWLAMESLRQLRLTGKSEVFSRLDNVLLAAPDIDLDVFRAQVAAVGRLEPPITVLASPDDRALDFSSRLAGDRYRLGELNVRDPRIQELAEAYGFQLIDISNMAATDSLNHDRFIGAATALRTVLTPRKAENPLRRAGAFFLDAVASVLEVPGRIGRAAAEGAQ
jgi:esterase/lipase superfamily enzyme